MSTSPIFTGNSQFSADFQAVIDKAVALASLPQQQYQNVEQTLNGQISALNDLNTKFSSLQTAIQSLQSASGIGSYSVSSSDGNVQPSITTSALPGTYSIEVTGLGSYAMSMSNAGAVPITDPSSQGISASSTYTLTVNNTTYNIKPDSNTLTGLANAINQTPGIGVQATLVNVGSTTSPDYRLSLQGTKLEADSIQLNDGTTDLLNPLVTGAPATYKVNGLPTEISSDSRTITLAPGLTVDLLKQSEPGVPSTITVSRSSSQIESALTNFATAYNAAVDALNQNRGQNGGALSGQSIVYELTDELHTLTGYSSPSGSVNSLTSLGMEFDQEGHLSLNTDTFEQATAANPDAALSFLGDGTTTGFLKSATDLLNSIEDSTSGIIPSTITSLQGQVSTQNQLITDNQNYVDLLKTNLSSQMASADALVASMEQQILYMNGLFSAMQTNAQTSK